MIGRIVDLDLLSTFPKGYGRINGGIERNQAFQDQQWSRREGKFVLPWMGQGRRRGGVFIPPRNSYRWTQRKPEIPVGNLEQKFAPVGNFSTDLNRKL